MTKPWVWFCAAAAFAVAARLYLGLAWKWIEVVRAWPAEAGEWGEPEIRAIQAVIAVALAALCCVLSALIGILQLRLSARRKPRETRPERRG